MPPRIRATTAGLRTRALTAGSLLPHVRSMMLRPTTALVALALFAANRGTAAEPAQPPQATAESLQRQIEELRQGQKLLLDELRELKELVRAGPERREVAAIAEPQPVITQNVRGEPFRGNASARVAIIEYSDFNCSFCANYATNVFPQIQRDFVATGKVRYLFRDLPERGDPDSMAKAQAARCAWEQGKFWEMHDRLFASPEPLLNDEAAADRHAEALGMDAAKFKACLKSGRHAAAIRRVSTDAQRFGLHGTPSFLIGKTSEDGNVVWATKTALGAESYETIRTNLEEFFAPAKK